MRNINIMLRTFSIIVTILGFTFFQPASAQNNTHHEFSLGYGMFSHEAINANGDVLEFMAFSRGKVKDSKSNGIFLLNYKYQIADRFSLGIGVGLEQFSGSTDNNYDWKRTDINVVPEFKFVFIETSLISIYGAAALGIIYRTDEVTETIYSQGTLHNGKDSKVMFAWHISPIGLRIGGKLAGYLEAGYGYKGIANLGISLKI